MKKKQENKLSMYRATETVLDTNNAKWSADTFFTAVKTEFSSKLAGLIHAQQRQKDIITGIAADKKSLRNLTVQKAGSVAAKVYMYAQDTNNNELLEEVNLSRWQMERARDELAIGIFRNIHHSASANLAALAAYGINAATLTALQTLINAYKAKTPQPRVAKAARKAVTIEMATLIKDIDKILKKRLDPLMLDFKNSEPEFYNTYRAARLIVILGATHTKLRLTVKNHSVVLQDATVSLSQNGQLVYSGSSGNNGKLVISKIKPGLYDLNIQKQNYQPKTETGINFKAGKEVVRLVTLLSP